MVQEQVAARFGIAPRAVLGVVLVGLAILAVLGVRLLLARDDAGVVPVTPEVVASPAATAGPVGAGSPLPAGTPGAISPSGTDQAVAAPPSAGSAQVVVHVVGRVRRAGVVRLPAGARVERAIAAAGGPRRDADLTRLNLARILVDGEQVRVPRPGEPLGPETGGSGGVPAGSRPGGVGGIADGSGSAAASLTPVDINTATMAELDTLPGVGPVLAQRILDWRAQNGRFTSVDELGEVSGIGDAVLSRLRPLVRL
jgi:competence protein ComEA